MAQKLHSLLNAVGVDVPEGLANPLITNISCDSRRVKKGDLFFGLPGEKLDGGSFFEQALSAGAVAAIIGPSSERSILSSHRHLVLVTSTSITELMGKLSSVFWGEPSSQMDLIGVTGTNGKTTTTHLIEFLGESVGRQTALFGTLVNRWPLHSETATHTTSFGNILNLQLAKALQSGASLGVMEVSSHSLSQRRVAGLHFSGAVFTNLTQDHLDYHETMESYFEAKSLLFQPPLIQPGEARVVVNIDDEWGVLLAERLKGVCWKSSIDPIVITSVNPELYITDIEMNLQGIGGVLHTPCGSGRFSTQLLGRFNLMNLLQAIGILVQQGFELEELLASIANFPGVPGRMESVTVENKDDKYQLPLVIVDYAHTPDGLRNALNAVKVFTSGKLICLFGCGGDRDKGKRSKMGEIAAGIADCVVITSDNPRTEEPRDIINQILEGIPSNLDVIIELDRASAIEIAISIAQAGDVVIIAGKGHEDYQIIGNQRVHFNDKEIAQTALLGKIKGQ